MQPLRRFARKSNQLWDMGNGSYIYIEKSVLDDIDCHRQHPPEAPESGGFLVGYYKGRNLHVINLTTPQSGDSSDRIHFTRLDPKHVEQVRKWYRISRGTINCLGEWHTHPEPYPKPSSIDIQSWQLFNKERQGQKAIFLIAGTKAIWLGEHIF